MNLKSDQQKTTKEHEVQLLPQFTTKTHLHEAEFKNKQKNFLLDYTSFTPAPVLYGPTSLGDTFTVKARARLSDTLNLTTRQRQTALNALATPSLELHFQSTIRYNTIFNHPFHATTPSITTRTTPPPFICTELIYKFDRYTQQTLGFATFYNPHTGLTYTCRFN